jgi:hypothetical protein
VKRLALVLSALSLVSSLALAATPERAKGISVHMLPKRVADLGKRQWGFVVSYAEYLKPEPAQPVLQSPDDLLQFVRKQSPSVQDNGVWIVTTHPEAYSDSEQKLLEDVKTICRRESIPLFIASGSELPNGWRRYDNAP